MENYKYYEGELLSNQLDEYYPSPDQGSQQNSEYDYDSPQTILKLEETLNSKKNSAKSQKPISQSILNLDFDDGSYSCPNSWECIYCNAINENYENYENMNNTICVKCNKNNTSLLFTSFNNRIVDANIKSDESNNNDKNDNRNILVLNNNNNQQNNSNTNNIFIYTPQLTLENNQINSNFSDQCSIPEQQFQNSNECQYTTNYQYMNNETSELTNIYPPYNNNINYKNPIKNDMNSGLYNYNNYHDNNNMNYKNYNNNNLTKNNGLNSSIIPNNNNHQGINHSDYQLPIDTTLFGDNLYPNFNYHRNMTGGKIIQKNRSINRATQFTRVRCKNIARVCHRCGTNTTPKWRRAPPPNRYILCNACGLQCNKDIDTNMNDSNIDVTCFCQGKFCVEAREQGIYLKRRLFNRKLKLCFYCNKERRSQELPTMSVTEYLI